jgi:lysophospholipase L1-like esterase
MLARITRGLAAPGLAALAALATTLALDGVVDRLDLGYRPRRNAAGADFTVARSEFRFRVVTNALGFRDPRLPGPKPPATVRVVVVGDSFTQGYGVREDEAYPRRLEARLGAHDAARRFEVVNLGVPGTNPRDYLGNLRDVGLAYRPDVVLVAVGANDVHDVRIQPRTGTQFGWERLSEAQRAVARPRPLWRRLPGLLWPALYPFAHERVGTLFARLRAAPGSTALAAGPPAGAARPRVPPERWREVLLALADAYGRRDDVAARLPTLDAARAARLARVATGALSIATEEGEEAYWSLVAFVEPDLVHEAVVLPARYDEAWRRVAACLRAIVRLARQAGAAPVLTYVPDQHQVTAAARAIVEERGFRWDPRTLTDTTFADRLRALAAEADAPFVDLLAAFRRHAEAALYFPRDGHWTAAGHDLAARLLADGLRESGALPQPPARANSAASAATVSTAASAWSAVAAGR